MKSIVILSALIYATCGAIVPRYMETSRNQQLTWNIVLPDGENMQENLALRIPRTIIETETKKPEQDVYWRPWKGEIPSDAVIGGYTRSETCTNSPIFMAQAYIKSFMCGIQPAQIFKYSKSVKATYGGNQYETDENIKILCAKDQSILTWISVNQTKHLTADSDCVIGGYEGESNVFFGRTIGDDEVIIGKASIEKKVMHYAYIGKEKFINNFEVLCYKRALIKIAESERKNGAEKETEPENKTETDIHAKLAARPHFAHDT